MFKFYSTNAPKSQLIEELLVTDNEAIAVGELLKISSGKLTKASGTDKPEFVSVGIREAGTNVVAPVVRLMENDIYQTELSAAPAENATLAVGDTVTISADGLKATATKTSGVFTITELEGTTVSSMVRGMFRR